MQGTVQERLESVKDGIRRLSVYRDMVRRQAASAEADEAKLRYRAELHQKCSELFKTWLEDSMEKNVHSISELATSGLQHVIHDQDITFSIKQEPKYNRLAMRFVLEQNGVEGDPLASFGGGTAVLISFVLRLAVMTRMKMGNLLLLDESMASLANAYVPSAASFMRELAEKTGVNILMVTHNPEFLSQAHVAYEGHQDDRLRLKLRRIHSSEPT